MLLTVTPNAAVDKTFQVEHFEIDRVHRPTGYRAVAGGKGINVARVYHALGGHVMATGFLGGHIGGFIADSLREIGIPDRFVETKEESRTCIAVIDTTTHTQTEVNENGPSVTAAEVDVLRRRFHDLLGEGVTRVALCGSLPPDCPDTLYADLIRIAARRGVPCAIDSSGTALREGIEARPCLVKCNRTELLAAMGLDSAISESPDGRGDATTRPTERLSGLIASARSLLNGETRQVSVTMGAGGAIAVDAKGAWFAPSPPISFVSAVGSGDAFLAAFLLAAERGEELASCLEWGVAAGAANAEVIGAGFCRKPEIERLRERTRSRLIMEE